MGATWSGTVLFDAPMAYRVLRRAPRILRQRGGKPTLERETTTWQIIEAWENCPSLRDRDWWWARYADRLQNVTTPRQLPRSPTVVRRRSIAWI